MPTLFRIFLRIGEGSLLENLTKFVQLKIPHGVKPKLGVLIPLDDARTLHGNEAHHESTLRSAAGASERHSCAVPSLYSVKRLKNSYSLNQYQTNKVDIEIKSFKFIKIEIGVENSKSKYKMIKRHFFTHKISNPKYKTAKYKNLKMETSVENSKPKYRNDKKRTCSQKISNPRHKIQSRQPDKSTPIRRIPL